MSRSRVILVVFTVTAFLILTIYLRNSASRMHYQYYKSREHQKQLRQQLWQNQLRFESLVNPAGLPQPQASTETETQEAEQ